MASHVVVSVGRVAAEPVSEQSDDLRAALDARRAPPPPCVEKEQSGERVERATTFDGLELRWTHGVEAAVVPSSLLFSAQSASAPSGYALVNVHFQQLRRTNTLRSAVQLATAAAIGGVMDGAATGGTRETKDVVQLQHSAGGERERAREGVK